MHILSKRRTWAVLAATVATLVGSSGMGASAQVVGVADLAGRWADPFEEGGAGVSRCQPAEDDARLQVCKPTAQAIAVLPDGRLVYFNGLESQENSGTSTVLSASPTARDSRTRLLDLRSSTPQFVTPEPERPGQKNPNLHPGHKEMDDPVGMLGVPGRPGDGFVGSTWGRLGLPEHSPTSTPDDPADNDGDMFCADLITLPDGRVLVVGGSDWYNQPSVMDRNAGDPADIGLAELEGLRTSQLFDWRTNTWTPGGVAKYGRWYPGVVGLADGKVLAASGATQIVSNTQLSQVRRTETYDPATNTWTENYTGPESESSLPLQPRLFLAPNGKVFYGGVGQMWGPVGEAVDEATFGLQQYFDPATKRWEVIGLDPVGGLGRNGAFQVPLPMTPPYEEVRLLTFGGTLGPPPSSWIATPLATLTTLHQDGRVVNRMTGTLNRARWFGSGVVLPEGSVLAVGGADKDALIDPGSEIAVRVPELYDAARGSWVEMAPHARDRVYHNTAVLLPDMRVLLGGHAPHTRHFSGSTRDQGKPFANDESDPSFEIWSPPYLFRGERPSITSAPAGIAYRGRFVIKTPHADAIESVVLIKTPSVQHVNDSDQRSLLLSFEPRADGALVAEAPPTGTVAPPGYYYLVVNRRTAEGPVPSVARMVRVGTEAEASEASQPFPDDAPAPIGRSATPDADTSEAATALRAATEAARSAPAPLSGPAATVAGTAGSAYRELGAVLAGTKKPKPPTIPALPLAALAVAAGALRAARSPGRTPGRIGRPHGGPTRPVGAEPAQCCS